MSEKYLYGCILPDLLKELGTDRSKTHFTEMIEKDGSIKFLPQMEVAKNELKYKLDNEVYLGYISHLIEDYIWFDKYIPALTKKLNDKEVLYFKDNTIHSIDEYRKDIYADYRYFAKHVIDKCNTNFVEVINSILNNTNDEEKELLTKNTDLNVNIVDKPILIMQRNVDNYINECIKEIDKVINELNYRLK